MNFFIMDFFITYKYWQKNWRKWKLHSIFAGLGNGPHVLGNGPHVLGNGPHVLGNGPHVLGNGPHALGNRPYLCTQFMNTGLFLLWGG